MWWHMEPICDMHPFAVPMKSVVSLGNAMRTPLKDAYQCPDENCQRIYQPWTAYLSVPNVGNNRHTKRCDCNDKPYMAIIDISDSTEQSLVTLGCLSCKKTTTPIPIDSALFFH